MQGPTTSQGPHPAVDAERLTLMSGTIQKFDPPEYSFQAPAWVDVKTLMVRGRSKIKTVVVATDHNSERYRTIVRYKMAKPVTTRPIAVRIWRSIRSPNTPPTTRRAGRPRAGPSASMVASTGVSANLQLHAVGFVGSTLHGGR